MRNLFVLLFLSVLTAGLSAQSKSVLTLDVGSFAVSILSEGQEQGKTNILIDATEEMIRTYLPGGTYISAVNAFLVETPDKTVLVDAGFGAKLFDNLKTLKKSAGDIDIILLTHMHGDHITGLMRDGKKTFPSAALYIPQPEYDYWMSDKAMEKVPENRRGSFTKARETIRAYKDKLHLFMPQEAGSEMKDLLPGVQGIAAYGHTPGHTGYLLESDGSKFLIWGDLTHVLPVQIPCPQIAVTYDVDPSKAIESRQHILKYVTDHKIRIAGMHIEFPGMGDVRKNASGTYNFTMLCECEGR